MKGLQKALAALLLTAFLAPTPLLAEEELLLADPADGVASQEQVTIEEPREILATSTEVVASVEEVVEELAQETPTETVVPEEVITNFDLIDPDSYVSGEVIVRFEGEKETTVLDVKDVPELLEELSNDPQVEYAEPNFVRSVGGFSTSSDHLADLVWGVERIKTSEAWAYSTGTDVIVAVIDSGMDYTHPDLAANMWDGSACVGVDSSGNTINGGCLHGFDFVGNDSDPRTGVASTSQHATHVAGTIAAIFGNQIGVMGVAPGAKIMALRIIGDNGSGNVAHEVAAIRFAIANGARIINASYAGAGESVTEREAIEEFQAAGGIFVAAASNNGEDSDVNPMYPAAYPLDSIVSVAATTDTDTLTSFSNYGKQSVDIGAPGVGVLSTYPGSGYAWFDGTSMATPHVTGVAALLSALKFTHRTALKSNEIKELMLTTGDSIRDLKKISVSESRVNAYAAVTAALALDVEVVEEEEQESAPHEDRPRRSGGGGGGGGSRDDDDEIVRYPQVLGATTLTPEQQARLEYLTALVRQLLALIAAMKAAGLE